MKTEKLVKALLVVALCLTSCTRDTSRSILYESSDADTLTICSFNIQFLGHFKKKDDNALAEILKDSDIVVVQELVTPPIAGTYPDIPGKPESDGKTKIGDLVTRRSQRGYRAPAVRALPRIARAFLKEGYTPLTLNNNSIILSLLCQCRTVPWSGKTLDFSS
jgi:hypothetical protein